MSEESEEDRPPRRPASLRLRLTLLATITLVVSLGGVGLALDTAYRRGAEASLSQQMESWAYGIMAAVDMDENREIRLSVEPADPLLLQPGSGVFVLIETPTDRWLSVSALGGAPPDVTPLQAGQTAFVTPTADSPWFRRSYGLAWQLEDGELVPLTVSILVHRQRLAPALAEYRRGLWRYLGAAAVLLALAQLVFAVISLRPLRRVAQDVARVEAGSATRLQGPYPAELEPLTRNVDRLLETEQANQARYRNALDSLAHSLKTPLAVLKAGGPDEAARHRALEDMELLIATRLERASAGTRRALAAPLEVAPVAERVAATLRKVHSQDLRTLECRIETGLRFFGEARDLMELLGNLLDNACKYGDGAVRLEAAVVDADAHRPGIRLTVGNDGEPADLARLVQRGRRGDERAEGHGLGLTIVSEVASAYGGRVGFGRSSLGGSEVTVTLPPGDGRGARGNEKGP